MMSIRKIQLLSAAVIANGALALTLMSPQDAQAASCSPITACSPSLACSLPEYACSPPPGCQLVSVTCGALCSSWPVSQVYVTCNYAPL